MPYKDKKKQAEYLKRYRTPYMREYMRFKREQQRRLEEAIKKGQLDVAKTILGTKPNINVFGKRKKRKK